ncbi:hypothetical protein ABIE50_002328 [Chitinophaga sp. OAE865]
MMTLANSEQYHNLSQPIIFSDFLKFKRCEKMKPLLFFVATCTVALFFSAYQDELLLMMYSYRWR